MLLAHRGFRLSGLLLILAFGLAGATISTPFAADNNQSGNMFDVPNLSGGPVLLLETSRVYVGASAKPVTASEHYKAGSFGGSELTPGD